jgi:hypothetical protein
MTGRKPVATAGPAAVVARNLSGTNLQRAELALQPPQ